MNRQGSPIVAFMAVMRTKNGFESYTGAPAEITARDRHLMKNLEEVSDCIASELSEIFHLDRPVRSANIHTGTYVGSDDYFIGEAISELLKSLQQTGTRKRNTVAKAISNLRLSGWGDKDAIGY